MVGGVELALLRGKVQGKVVQALEAGAIELTAHHVLVFHGIRMMTVTGDFLYSRMPCVLGHPASDRRTEDGNQRCRRSSKLTLQAVCLTSCDTSPARQPFEERA